MSTEKPSDYRRLLKYVVPYRLAFLFSIVGMLGYAGVDTLFVYTIQPLIDNGLSNPDSKVLLYAPIFVIVVLFLRGVCSFIANYGLAWVGSKVVMVMRQEMFARLVHLPVPFFDKNTTGDLISKVTFNTEQVSNAASKAITTLIQEGAFVIGLLCMMFYYSWQLSLIFLLIGPLVGFVVNKVSRRFRKISKGIQNAMGEVTTATEQMLNGHKVVLSYGGQDIEKDRFNKVSNHTRQQIMKMRSVEALSSPIIQVIASFALAGVLFVASLPGMVETLTAGTFASMVTAMIIMLRPLKKLTSVQSDFQRGITAARSIFEIIDEIEEKDSGTKAPTRAQGTIEFNKVTFTYPGKEVPALQDVSFNLKAGQSLALVGRSGSGKSTITQLLTRFYEAESGQIKLDDELVGDYTLASLRRQIAVVSQQVILFNDSVANNIAYGLEGQVTRERIIDAATSAHAMEFIEQLPDGLDTEIGQNGVMLSGGQRQRLAIARAILRDAPILILDEATSALDTESERYIQEALESLQQNRTSIVVAHRLSTIENADVIAVVDEGHIIEMGTHTELLQRQGAYAQLHQMQFSQ
ncbi:lipid A export permease/ATP-binding protein MsbA [Echinimonas agarilytica]|uniref:Lipid A export permease/ATP-binding protein MsbA n=1 Tax=Echinimonas agarilytica TaxID=1215918 RepID=A0AA42B806_9GAMM|nr:lipid A export permease/ATP-binding protein MsbA [Echinimonas agarilytica]MCM2679943.1 lipid A export permease/ATP-binding protein MsbA [Echinimonas agarilytica]